MGIQERMAMLQAEEEKAKQEQEALRQKDDRQRQHQIQQQQQQHQQQQQQKQGRLEQNKMEVEFSQRHQVQFEEPAEVDEEDSCPPDLEAVELQQQQQQQQQQHHHQQQKQQAVEAQRPVQQEQHPVQNLKSDVSNLEGLDSDLVRNLAIAIKASMENYQGLGGTYEPSADELIDVLKNLENLAALNPALYRAIVDQIKVCHSTEIPEQNNVANC